MKTILMIFIFSLIAFNTYGANDKDSPLSKKEVISKRIKDLEDKSLTDADIEEMNKGRYKNMELYYAVFIFFLFLLDVVLYRLKMFLYFNLSPTILKYELSNSSNEKITSSRNKHSIFQINEYRNSKLLFFTPKLFRSMGELKIFAKVDEEKKQVKVKFSPGFLTAFLLILIGVSYRIYYKYIIGIGLKDVGDYFVFMAPFLVLVIPYIYLVELNSELKENFDIK